MGGVISKPCLLPFLVVFGEGAGRGGGGVFSKPCLLPFLVVSGTERVNEYLNKHKFSHISETSFSAIKYSVFFWVLQQSPSRHMKK